MTLQIRTVPVASLKLDPDNAREHPDRNLDAIADSLREFGQVIPLVVTPDLVIRGGNGTFLAARDRLGWTELDVVESAPEDVARAKALALALNRTAELAAWDERVLFEQLSELTTAGFAPATLGFNDADLERLRPREEMRDDPVPAKPKKPRTKSGDVLVLGPHRVLCGDCTDRDLWPRLLAGRTAQAVITDPPYGMSYLGTGHEPIAGDDLRGDDLVALVAGALKLAAANAEATAAFYVWHASSTRDDFARALAVAGLAELETIVWVKPSPGPGNGHYRRSFEPCFYAGRAGSTPAWYGDRREETVWRAATTIDAAAARRATVVAGGLLITGPDGEVLWLTDQPPKKKARHLRLEAGESLELQAHWASDTVWEVGRTTGIDHPTPKPLELMRRSLENSTGPGDLVVDPFLGSGSTLVAAERLGRRCAGFELDPGYCDVIADRWAALTGGEVATEPAP